MQKTQSGQSDLNKMSSVLKQKGIAPTPKASQLNLLTMPLRLGNNIKQEELNWGVVKSPDVYEEAQKNKVKKAAGPENKYTYP